MSCCPEDCTTIRINSSSAVTLSGVTDVDGNYVNDGVCSFELVDPETDSNIGSGSMPYLSNTNGNYRGTITAGQTEDLIPGKTYVVRVVITSGSYQLQDDLEVVAE